MRSALTLLPSPLSIEMPAQHSMATIDEDLSQLEKDIRQLKIDYEQYFGGGKKRPPTDTEWRIDTMLKRYSDRGAAMNYTQRFRYSNLAQTYSKYREMFRKRLKQKEEGTVQRHFGAAAREIEKERAQQARRRSAIRRSHPISVRHFVQGSRPRKEKSRATLRRVPQRQGTGQRKHRKANARSISAVRPAEDRPAQEAEKRRTKSSTSCRSKASTRG